MKRNPFKALMIIVVMCISHLLYSADLDILVIGSSHSFSEGNESGVVQEKAFNPSNIATQLSNILSDDPAITDTVNVVFEDIYKTKTILSVQTSSTGYDDITFNCYSLAQHYMWTEGRASRLANLRGEDGTAWDYVVIMADPYIIANFPGMYTEGAIMLINEVKKGTAVPVLMAQWPENSSTFTATQFNEIVYRVGDSLEVPVVSAGLGWSSLSPQDTSVNHPTPKGAYLAASAIYSKLYDKSAKTSDYTYDDSIADHSLTTVQASESATHYTGVFGTLNVFTMKYLKKRLVSFRETGTSTEDYLRDALFRLDERYGITFTTTATNDPTDWDFNYGRGNDWWEDDKDYEVNPDIYDRSYGFPMHYYGLTNSINNMPYGIDKTYNGGTYNDGTDLGIAYNMIRPGTRELSLPEDVRAIPIRLLYLKMREIVPAMNPLHDNTHMHFNLNDASVAFMYTLLSGRCPLVDEPTTQDYSESSDWMRWFGNKIGYETAWRMSHISSRVPGFQVLPSAATANEVTPGSSETLSVRFFYPPTSDITVSVTANATSAAIVNPKTLTFNDTNYDTVQNVNVVGVPGASSSQIFNVEYTTTSDDEVYEGLSDSWEYTNNRVSTESVTVVNQSDRQETAPKNGSKTISLNVTGSSESNTVLAMPFHGTLSWSGPNVVYTPEADYIGSDSFAFAVNTGGTLTRGYIEITVEDVPEVKIVETGGSTDVVEGGATDTYDVFLSEAPVASVTVTISTDSQVNVSPTSLSFTTGNWSDPQTVTVTAVNDGIHELIHNGTVSHTTSSSDPNWEDISVNDVTPTITDDDNQLPTVEAGDPQTVTLDLSENWTPAEIATYSWYDANDAATIIESGGAVSQWNDKSGNNKNATQSNGAKQPTTGTRTIGGLNALNFDATEDFDVPSFDLIGKECWTVINKDTADDFHVLGSSSNIQVGVLSSGKMRIWPSFSSDTQSTTLISIGSDYFLGFRAVNPKTYSINGTEEATTNTPTGALTINHIMENQYAHNSDGLIGEIVITAGELNTEDRQRMEGYLAWKWGMEANLPTDHPHKDATPGNPGIIVNLDGTVGDPDTDPLTTTWSLHSGPGGATVTFGDASAVDTTALFTETGTYVLRLTADDTIDQNYDEITITVNEPNSLPEVSVTASDAAASEEGPDNGTYTITRTGETTESIDVVFVLSGGATETSDYSINATSPVTIPAGQSSVVVTLTPVDDSVNDEGVETATLTISPDAAYNIGTPSADINIGDNDSTYSLTVVNGIDNTDSNPYLPGTGISITADSPPANSHFVNWTTSAGGSFADDTSASTTFTMPTNAVTITANFALDTYTLTYNAGTGGSITGTTPQAIDHGSDGTEVTAVPDTGYRFVDWSDTNTNATRQDTNITADLTVTANFVLNSAPEVNAGLDQTVYMGESTLWAPSELSPELWLDADDETTVILNGGTVQQWNDKSGNGRNATQATATSQPTDTADGLNGKHVLTFDGNSDYFGVDLDFMAGVDHSTFIVTKPTTYTDIYGAANASAGANSLHVGFSSASAYRMNYWGNDWNGTVSANFQAGSANILNYVWLSGTDKEIFANGKSEGTRGSAGVIGTMSGGGRIGAVVNHGNYGGDIAEFIVFSGPLSQADREKMEGYLAHKWGLQGSLPVDHPYKSEAPGAPGATASLDGAVTDANGDTPTTTWTKTSGPGTVTFDDDSVVDTTANFDTTGTYVLRLTADDGSDQAYDEVTINVETVTPHAADTNSDWSISPAEVSSFISSYSSNSNSVTGDAGSITDGRITMREVMRVIYLYNDGGAYIGGQETVDSYDIEVVAQGAQAAPKTTTETGTGDTGNGSLTVSSTADSGVGSLRNAIAIAGDGETIMIDGSIDTLTVLSEIVIDKSITIDGNGTAIVSGDKITRIFRIQNDTEDINVSIKNIGIVDAENAADEFGGAIYNNAQTLTLDTVLFDGNANTTEDGKGGAVYSSGTLNTVNCIFQNNTATEENDVYSEN